MSAICGVVGVDGRPWSVADLKGMVRALAPLGGDGGGTWVGMTGRCGVAVAAGLRHSTPEDAADRQPAENHDGSLVLVGDLRVDNRGDIAGVLGVPDDRSIPDSAFVLAAYERWGDEALDRFLGEFAIAIVDRRRGGVLLARDHAGARPLAVHQRAGVVAFASNALALTAFEGVGHSLDVEHAAEVLALAHSSERTFVEGVLMLPPATALWIDDSGVRRQKWWEPDPHEIVDLGSPAAHALELREALDIAVGARLRSIGAIAASTSGGLDSTSAAATAARLLAPEPLRTYTSAPPPEWQGIERPGWDADESPIVRALAEMHPNIAPSFVHVSSESRLFNLQEPLWELGAGPARNPCNMMWMYEIRARAGVDGVTTLIHADHGNLFFSADGPEWLVSHLRAGHPITALRQAATWRESSGDGWYRALRAHLLPYLLPVGSLRLVRRVRGRPSPRDEWIAMTGLRPKIASSLDLTKSLPQLDDRRRGDRRALVLSVLGHHAGQADLWSATAALTGVEARDPTADRRLIEAAMRQPEWVRRRDGITRATARGAMTDRLPAAIVNRTRRGEQLPDWLDVMTPMRAEFKSELDELVSHPTSRELIDVVRLRDLLNRWPDRSAWADQKVVFDYRLVLLRALVVSRYLRWFERRGAATRST